MDMGTLSHVSRKLAREGSASTYSLTRSEDVRMMNVIFS